jgi:DNA-binding transcriptional MerR regulator/methylmalonyl-CoA mutase cobalamin-binding subunit
MYSIKAVSQATGLTAETLRAWERRYGIVAPRRDDSGRRVYTPEDVLRLKRLRDATRRGHPIRRLAGLDDDALAALLETSPGPRGATSYQELVERILDAAARYEPAACEQALALACTLLSPTTLVGEVLAPVLEQVGERWRRGELTIAQERLVSSAVRRYAGTVLQSFAQLSHGEPIVFATLPGERHELGLLLAALVCASRGHRVHYLGADLPPLEIARYAAEVAARIVALSLVSSDKVAGATEEIRTLALALAPHVMIWIGGVAARSIAHAELPAACAFIVDELELERRLDLLEAA